MSLYENWINRAFTKEGTSVDAVWDEYLPREQKIYEYLLGEKVQTLKGTVSELAERFSMSTEEIVAFVDGINEVLPKPYAVNVLDENSDIDIYVDYEKLFKKMVEYKAEHLYTLPQWNGIFDEEKQKELIIEQRKSRTVVKGLKVGRNDPCPCGSGKKYKKCCGA